MVNLPDPKSTLFTTRSDIGPAREGPSAEAVAAAREKRGEEGGGEEEATEQFQDPDNETGLFAGMVYEADDAEADRIYEQVDKQMEERRRARKEAKEKEETERLKAENPTIQERFSDLKRGLADVTDEQWETLPEVGNLTGKRRKLTAKNDYKSYAVSDSVLIGARDKNGMVSSLDPTVSAPSLFHLPRYF
jgi:pre-mRNA-processing factor 6